MRLNSEQEQDVIAALDRCRMQSTTSLRELFAHLVIADRAELWRSEGCRDMSEWVSGRYGISKWQAQRWVHAAHRLEELPLIAGAFARGEIGVEKVVELCRYALPEIEEGLLAWAKRVQPKTIREQADRALAGHDDAKEMEKSRYLRWWWDNEGRSLDIQARLPALEGAQFVAAIDALADKLPESPDRADEQEELDYTDDEREAIALQVDPFADPEDFKLEPIDLSIDHRRADALALLVSGGAAHEVRRATVVVHAELKDLQAQAANEAVTGIAALRGAQLERGVALHPATAARLSCDCSLEVVGYDEERAVGIKRASREPPRWLRRQVLKRDHGTCLFPGCGRSSFLQAHHIVAWEAGGETNLDNLATLCHFHHKLVHEYRWRMRLGRIAGTAEWFRPDGIRYEPEPVLRAPPLFDFDVVAIN